MRHVTETAHRRNLVGLCLLVLLIVAAGLLLKKSYHLSIIGHAAILGIAALGMFVLFGYTGQISIGQAAFFGVGAYVSALLVMRLNVPPPLALVASVAASACLGWLVSRPLLRLETNYLALATLAFGLICFNLFAQMKDLTGGLDPGIVGMPPFRLFGYELDGSRPMYWLVMAFLVVALLATFNIVHSRTGRALRALRSSEVAASGLGVDTVRYKVAAFTFASALTGLAGSLFAFSQGAFSASTFGIGLSIEILVMVVIGSISSPWGTLFGAFFVSLLPTVLQDYEQYRMMIFGAILTVIMIFMPDGLGKAVFALLRRGVTRGGAR